MFDVMLVFELHKRMYEVLAKHTATRGAGVLVLSFNVNGFGTLEAAKNDIELYREYAAQALADNNTFSDFYTFELLERSECYTELFNLLPDKTRSYIMYLFFSPLSDGTVHRYALRVLTPQRYSEIRSIRPARFD